jgi:hypothetical protein
MRYKVTISKNKYLIFLQNIVNNLNININFNLRHR